MNNREFGARGEDLACEYLKNNGYEILERNKHFSKLCEVDIIAKIKNKIVFVEVKTRKSDAYGNPLEAITKTKYQNIKTGVLNYLQEHNINDYQIDAIGITIYPKLKIDHLKNV